MDERLRFVARLLDGEAMCEVCRAFGISRKTGYKIFERYKEHGLEALTDRSRRPVRYANPRARSTPCFTGTAWSNSRVVRGAGDFIGICRLGTALFDATLNGAAGPVQKSSPSA
jgi:Helix-turn-helix domain